MTVIRRVVFGEPKPGEAQFAGLLSKLDESVSYCNRVGDLAHDRVTDLPFAVPALGLNFVHPTPLSFVSGPPADGDDWGIFAEHHIGLYDAGVRDLRPVNYVHLECARLCRGIYANPGDAPVAWDERLCTAGVEWGVILEGKSAFVVFEGSKTPLDWIRDLIGFAPSVYDVKLGAMWGGFVIGMEYAWEAIKPLLVNSDEIIFTGHSLGAARADIAAAYAVMG